MKEREELGTTVKTQCPLERSLRAPSSSREWQVKVARKFGKTRIHTAQCDSSKPISRRPSRSPTRIFEIPRIFMIMPLAMPLPFSFRGQQAMFLETSSRTRALLYLSRVFSSTVDLPGRRCARLSFPGTRQL